MPCEIWLKDEIPTRLMIKQGFGGKWQASCCTSVRQAKASTCRLGRNLCLQFTSTALT
jgi:hypothetical protein